MRLTTLLAAIILAVSATCASGQTIGCSAQTSVFPNVGASVNCSALYQGPGDIIPTATAFYGLRAYTAAIAAAGTQKLINVHRTSDSETCDVLVAANGGMGLTANCSGADSGKAVAVWLNATTGTVATWYDQSGNADNTTQATVINQATLTLSCLGSAPCLTVAGSAFMSATGASIAQPLSMTAVAERTAGFTAQAQILEGGNGIFFNGTANTIGEFFGTSVTAAGNDSSERGMVFSVNGASSAIYIDGTSTAVSPGALALSGPFLFFGNSISAATLTGNVAELGIWPVAFTATQAGNMCHNQRLYFGTSGTC